MVGWFLAFCPTSIETPPKKAPKERKGEPVTKGQNLSKEFIIISFFIGKTPFSFVRLLSYCPGGVFLLSAHAFGTKAFVRTFYHHPPSGIEASQ